MTDTVYFVDDNFIGNRKAAMDLLPHLIEWQKRTGYVVRLACEATLNIAKRPEILEKMREAYFITIFCGIETSDPDALKEEAQGTHHDSPDPGARANHQPLRHGGRVPASSRGSTPTRGGRTPRRRCWPSSRSPGFRLLTINLLQALPKTPLSPPGTVWTWAARDA